MPYCPSHSHFLLKIIELNTITTQIHILLMRLYAGPDDRYAERAQAGERERRQAARILRNVPRVTLDC